jgi:hypothetical protein
MGEKLLSQLLKWGALCLCTIILATAAVMMHNDYRAAQAISAGADPLATACALGGAQQVCALAAARGGK